MSGAALFRHDIGFTELGLCKALVDQCEKSLNLKHPTDIQVKSIPAVLKGENVCGSAPTGSGKTAAFALPILHHLSRDPYGVFAVVVLPVRELAAQVAEQFTSLGSCIGARVQLVVGGQSIIHQAIQFTSRPHIVVATPGRLASVLEFNEDCRKMCRKMKFLVLDEADHLIDDNFMDQVDSVLGFLPSQKVQKLLFSATLNSCVETLSKKFGVCTVVDCAAKEQPMDNLRQTFVMVPRVAQLCYLRFLLTEHFANQSAIIFTLSVRDCELVTRVLKRLKMTVCGLHSLMSQADRTQSLYQFKAGSSTILVATDLAARGLDIPQVGVVINLDVPDDPTLYVHRVGRTARAGRKGLCVTFVTSGMGSKLARKVEKATEVTMEPYEMNEDAAQLLLASTSRVHQEAIREMEDDGFEERLVERKEMKRKDRSAKMGGKSTAKAGKSSKKSGSSGGDGKKPGVKKKKVKEGAQ